MLALLQRVTQAHVEIDQQVVGKIDAGLMVLLGVEKGDDMDKVKRLSQRLLNYRVFSDGEGKMNLNVQQAGGDVLVVSQFTLAADTRKGNRPSFSSVAPPEESEALYEAFVDAIRTQGVRCETGQFGADMQVSLTNDGPVTFQLHV